MLVHFQLSAIKGSANYVMPSLEFDKTRKIRNPETESVVDKIAYHHVVHWFSSKNVFPDLGEWTSIEIRFELAGIMVIATIMMSYKLGILMKHSMTGSSLMSFS